MRIDGEKAEDPALEISPEKPAFSRLENVGLHAYGYVKPESAGKLHSASVLPAKNQAASGISRFSRFKKR